ncbi:MAG: hypothetical protein FWH01_16330 [Oscillospiraceae bacterium]|nr:hypothetical protein [Oscillospiraceae bacterium]
MPLFCGSFGSMGMVESVRRAAPLEPPTAGGRGLLADVAACLAISVAGPKNVRQAEPRYGNR